MTRRDMNAPSSASPTPPPGWEALKARLARSAFRSRFKLSEKDRATIARDGWETVRAQARLILEKRIGAAEPVNDGRQTPMRGHPVFIAQHATGTCCRGCLAKWHSIPTGRPLTPAELDRLADILVAWMRDKAGDLSAFPHQETLGL